jgi:hypothetical protein
MVWLLQDTVTTLLYDAIGDVDQKSVPVSTGHSDFLQGTENYKSNRSFALLASCVITPELGTSATSSSISLFAT